MSLQPAPAQPNETKRRRTGNTIDFLARFRADAHRDMSADIEWAFSGELGRTHALEEVSDVARIRFPRLWNGTHSPEDDALLKVALTRQVETYQAFCRIWTQENPDPETLFRVNAERQEYCQRWQVFMSMIDTEKSLSAAYDYAFRGYPYASPRFQNAQARALWIRMLHAEQQAFVREENPRKRGKNVRESVLPGLYSQATHAALIEKLFDGSEHSVRELLQAYGKFSLTKPNRDDLSRRVSELNQLLLGHYGPPPAPRKKWIQNTQRGLYGRYQFCRPV